MRKIISIIISFACLFLIFYYFANNGYFKKHENINKNIESSNYLKTTENKFKIIAIGDSLTAGYNLSLEESYPKILEKKLLKNNLNIEVINAGISGETTAGLLERIEFIKSQNPEMVLITIGGNDAFRNLPIENTKENIQKIIKSLKEKVKGENIYILQIQAPANLGLTYAKEFNNIYKNISRKEKVNLVPFVTKEVFLSNEYMLSDGIHPNGKGYEYLVNKYIYPALIGNLEK